MIPLYTAEQSRQIDATAIRDLEISGQSLMARAGAFAYEIAKPHWPDDAEALVVCGSGNNGGDGYVVAVLALKAGKKVRVLQVKPPTSKDAIFYAAQYQEFGGQYTDLQNAQTQSWALVIDALFGTGLNRAPTDEAADTLKFLNGISAYKLALDIPSGLNGDTGQAYDPCFRAHATATFITHKTGQYTGAAKGFIGSLNFSNLEVPEQITAAFKHPAQLLSKPVMEKRNADSHKGQYGNVLVIGGSRGMLGAALLAGRSALKTGAGLVKLGVASEQIDQVPVHCPELMSFDVQSSQQLNQAVTDSDVVALGPGLDPEGEIDNLMQCVLDSQKKSVMDAGALRWLAHNPCRNAHWVLTPHPGEAAGLLKVSTADVQNDRYGAVQEIVNQYGGVCILKGAGSLVCESGSPVAVCAEGNPGMASAGMGDVLTGCVATLTAQSSSLFKAACTATWLHANGADHYAEEHGEAGLTASDVLLQIPLLMHQLVNE